MTENGPDLWDRLLSEVNVPGAVVAGGCIRDHRLELDAKDIDIFVPLTDRNAVAALGERLGLHLIEVEGPEAREYAEHFKGVLVGVLEGDLLGWPVNIVARVAHEGGTAALLESFDFGIVQCAWSPEDGYTQTTAHTHDLRDRTATLTLERNAELTQTSYERFLRFDARNPGVLKMVDPFSERFEF